MKITSTKDKILKEGMSLLQKHGYNGFSFQDIADILEIKKPSLYDHFSSKEELIIAILNSYTNMFHQWSQKISELPPLEQIRKAFDIFYSFTSDKKKVCPVLALSVDTDVLTLNIRKEMKSFIEKWLDWLEETISEGQISGRIRKDINSKSLASFIYSQGMGSQFQARLKNDPAITLSSGDMIVSLISLGSSEYS